MLSCLAVYVPWDIKEYYDKCVKGSYSRNDLDFPNPQLGSFSDPLTVVDVKGRIILWYIPGLMSKYHQVSISGIL